MSAAKVRMSALAQSLADANVLSTTVDVSVFFMFVFVHLTVTF